MKAFALYRLPYASECVRIVQHSGSALVDSDNGKLPSDCKGFVMVPFDATKQMVIIRGEREEIKMEDMVKDRKCEVESVEGTEVCSPYNFETFKSALDEDVFSKLVLSRCVTIDTKVDAEATFYEACRRYPRMMIYLCHVPEIGMWLGCTPEILLSGSKSHYRTVALAGTMKYAENVEWSDKNKHEQAIVADYIRNIIRRYADVIEEEGPYTSRAGQLIHLKTEFHFQPKAQCSIADIIDELHPTPAVCGVPKDAARHFIINNEGYDRKFYSGIVGMYDPKGETELFVNLRCAEITDKSITLYAGGGLLKASNRDSEWKETEEKMKTIKSCIQR